MPIITLQSNAEILPDGSRVNLGDRLSDGEAKRTGKSIAEANIFAKVLIEPETDAANETISQGASESCSLGPSRADPRYLASSQPIQPMPAMANKIPATAVTMSQVGTASLRSFPGCRDVGNHFVLPAVRRHG